MQNGIPDVGDIIRLYIGPGKGNEQDGYRAVLVLTDAETNELTGRIVALPITSTVRGWETEIPISSLARPGVALVDQIKTLSFKAREFKFADERATQEEMEAAKYAVKMFLNL
jgi:mRNA interferase MazF